MTYGDDEKYIKTKIKTYGDSVITNFHIKKIPTEKAPCKCSSIIMLDSVMKAEKKYYPQTLLEECIKIENFTDDDLEKKNLIVTLMMKQNLILRITSTIFFKKNRPDNYDHCMKF